MLKIKLLASIPSPHSHFKNAGSRLEKLISSEKFELVESNPDVLFFLTGGSERYALEQAAAGHFYILIGSQHDNAYASATEVKTYLDGENIPCWLLDEEDAGTKTVLEEFITARQAIEKLRGKRLGLIGQVSDWLIASTIPAGILKAKLGIDLVEIPWNKQSHFSTFKPDEKFLNAFAPAKDVELSETAKVSEMLSCTIGEWNLDAISVECFPLVQKDGVTACLPLARFNNEGIPAGCEGDLTAAAGMMLGKELTGIVPWMANINKVSNDGCRFSHCTIAPGLVDNLTIKTHFETGKGTAIHGDFKGDSITIYRFDKQLGNAFIATGTITDRPRSGSACRTQIEVKLSEKEVRLLKENPLGNHHLILPGNHKKRLQLACLLLGINVL